MSMSLLELRHVIESGLLPLDCRCSSILPGELVVEVFDPATKQNLVVGGVSIATLSSSRAIANLIAELRAEINSAENQSRHA